MDILIVDDEPLARRRLVRMVQSIGEHIAGGAQQYRVVGEAANGIEAIEAIEKYDPDIVLMDVRMPGADGIETAKKIAHLIDPPAVIFCTAFDEYAIEAFETLASGYLLKPVQEDQLKAALSKAKRTNKVQKSSVQERLDSNEKQRKNISAKTRKGMELIPLDDIHCFVAEHKYVTVVHTNGETLIDDTLKELEEEFPERLVRVHRNALVVIKEIEGMERASQGQFEIILKRTDFRPTVSRRHVAGVRELLSRL